MSDPYAFIFGDNSEEDDPYAHIFGPDNLGTKGGSLTGGLDLTPSISSTPGFLSGLYQQDMHLPFDIGSPEEIVAQAKKAQIPSINLGKMLDEHPLAKAALAVTGLPAALAIGEYGSKLGEQTTPEKIDEEANAVLEKHFEKRVANGESDLGMMLAGAVPQAIGSFADPINAGLMAAQAPVVKALSPLVMSGKAAVALGEGLAGDVTNPLLRAGLKKVGESVPTLAASAATNLPIGAAQTLLGNPNANASEVLLGAAKGALLNTAFSLGTEAYAGAREASSASRVPGDFNSAAEKINQSDSILDPYRTVNPDLTIDDLNYDTSPEGNVNITNRRTGELVGGGLLTDEGPQVSLTTKIDPTLHKSIEASIINHMNKIANASTVSEIVPQLPEQRGLSNIMMDDAEIDFPRQPEVKGSGPKQYTVQRWEDLSGSNPLRGGIWYRLAKGDSPDLNYKSSAPRQFNERGSEGGTYLNQKTFAPSNPIILEDSSVFGASSKAMLQKSGIDPFQLKDELNHGNPENAFELLKKFGIEEPEAKKLIDYTQQTGDSYPVLDRLAAHVAKSQGYDAIIRPQAKEYVDLTDPHVMGAMRVTGPDPMGLRTYVRDLKENFNRNADILSWDETKNKEIEAVNNGGFGPLAGFPEDTTPETQRFLEAGAVGEHVSHVDPEAISKLPSVPSQSVEMVTNAVKAIGDGAGAVQRYGALKDLLAGNGGDPNAISTISGPMPHDVVDQALDVAVKGHAPGPDPTTPPSNPPETTFPLAEPVLPEEASQITGTKKAFTFIPDKLVQFGQMLRKNYTWKNQLGSVDLATMAAKYDKDSIARKVLTNLSLLNEQTQEKVGAEMSILHGNANALSNAINDAASRLVEQSEASGQPIDPIVAKMQVQEQAYQARRQGTPDLIQDPELKQIHSDIWSKTDGAIARILDAVPASMRNTFSDLLGTYMERKYAIDIDPNFAVKMKELHPELVQPALDFVRDHYGITDEQKQWGVINNILRDKGVIPNAAGQAKIIDGVSKDIAQRRNLSPEAKVFWEKIQAKEAELKADPKQNYSFEDEFDSYLGKLRKNGSAKVADETYKLYLDLRKNNPKITPRDAVRLAWEDQSFPPVLRALAGEVKDPVSVYELTTASTIERAAAWQRLSKISKDFASAGLFSKEMVGPMATEVSSPDVYQALGLDKADGPLYTTPDVKLLLDGVNEPSMKNPVLRAAVSASKFSKIFSARGIARQGVQAPVQILSNGHMAWAIDNPGQFTKEVLPESVKAMLYFATGDNAHLTPSVEAGLRLGVLKPGAFAGEMLHFSNELKKMSPQAAEEKVKSALGDGLSFAGKAYGLADAFAMFTGWQIESRQLAWARDTGVTPEVAREAASYVKDTYQNTNRVPPWAKKISSNPWSAGFISFTAEMYRNQYQTAVKNAHYAMEAKRAYQSAVEYAKQGDMVNADRQMGVSGRFTTLATQGMAQQITALGAAATAGAAIKAQNGIDDKKEIAFRQTMAYPGQENSTYLFTHFKPGKSMEVIDTSGSDPYDPVSRWYNLYRNTPGGLSDKAIAIAHEFDSQFGGGPFGIGLIAKAGLEALTDKRMTITGPKDLPADQRANGNKLKMLENFTSKAFLPSQATDISRLYKAATGYKKPGEADPEYTLAGEALHMVGLERPTIQFEKRMIDRGGEFATGWQSLKANLDKQTTFKVSINPKLQKDLINQYKDNWDSSYYELMKHVQNAKALGMTYPDIQKALAVNKISNPLMVDSLFNGNKLSLQRYLNATDYWEKAASRR